MLDYLSIPAEISVIDRLNSVRAIEREHSDETERMLADFIACVADVIEDIDRDTSDFLADFDASEDRWFA
jgi:hypothetical protein